MKTFFDKYKYYIGAVFSIVLLFLALKDIDVDKLFFYFSFENLDILFYIIIINLVLRIVIALRWHKLLDKFPDNKFNTTYHFTNIGYFANNVLPARLGDIIKSYLLAKKQKYNTTQVLTSAVIERVFDLAGLSLLFLIAVLRYDIPEDIFRGGVIFVGLLIVFSIAVLFLANKKQFVLFNVGRLSKHRIVSFINSKIESILKYIKNYLNFSDLFFLFVSTGFIWFLYVFSGFVIIERLNGSLGWDASMLSLILLGVSFILPSTPGNIGVHQFACVVAFEILGMDKTQAVAFSFYYQIPVIIISVVLGIISIYYEGFSIKGINQVSREAKTVGSYEVS